MHKNKKSWVPTPLEMMKAQIAVLRDPINKKNNALFIHAPGTNNSYLDNKLINSAVNCYRNNLTNSIILNSLSSTKNKKKSNEYNYQTWKNILIKKGVEEKDIQSIPPSLHTAQETEQFLNLAKNKKWSKIIIATHPQHQLRCFLQIVAIMKKNNFWPKVYNLTHEGIPWKCNMEKKSLAHTVRGPLSKQIEQEYCRIINYAKKPKLNALKIPTHTCSATIPEMLIYLNKRD